jgi:hypothetical protein
MDDKLARAQALALQLMHQWQLQAPQWRFCWNRCKRMLGRCVYPRPGLAPGLIELSEGFVLGDNSEDLVRDTILHEIAHALAGNLAGHGPLWKAWCSRVGAEPERYGQAADMPAGVWQATCPTCNTLYSFHRKPKYLNLPHYFCSVPACGKRVQVLAFHHVSSTRE